MNTPLLVGLFGAWAAVQVALGVFFIQVYASRRRESEYLIFGFLCFGLALVDAGFAVAHAFSGTERWMVPSGMAHTGAFLSAALNVHFALQFVDPGRVRRVVPPMYFAAVVYSVLFAMGALFHPGTEHVTQSRLFGVAVNQVTVSPTWVAVSAYLVTLVEDAGALGLFAVAYRRGRREVRGALIGLLIVTVCAVVDVTNIVTRAGLPAVLPYGFLIYGFGVAHTVLVRYRRAADDLEVTASELRQATEELTNSYLELSVIQEELFRKRQLASVGELAAAIAHEVRNPLAIIVNAAANLKRPSLEPEDRNTLFGIIEEEIRRLNNIVTELLRYARPMNIRRDAIVLGDVVKGIGERLDPKYTLDLEVAREPELETLWADPTLLRLALQNLVDNARQAMPNGGSIVVSAANDRVAEATGVRIDVKDTGQGMDARTLRRAMDPFFSTRPSGTGLGLPIAGRIAEAHGGRIDVQSRVGEGTTVSLFIPGKRSDRASEPRIFPESRP